MIRAFIVVTYWAVVVVLGALIGFPVTFITRDITFLWNLAMLIARSGTWLAGIRVEAVGREKLDPKQPYVYMSNHVSNLDPPIIVPLLKRQISILTKAELFRVPILGTAFRIGKLVPVERRDRESAIESVRKAVTLLRSGNSMLVYPEGTRSRDGKLLPFKKGPFHMANEANVPIVPITMLGTRESWPKGKFAIYPGKVTAVFHEPIRPSDYPNRDALATAVRNAIESALPEQYRTRA